MNARFLATGGVVLAAVLLASASPDVVAQAPPPSPSYTVVSRDGRRSVAVRTIAGQEMFALDDLARLFELTLRDDLAAGGLTIATRAQTIVLSPGQPLASVGGRLVSLPVAPVRDGRAWSVPVEFVSRALAPALGTRIEVRKASRLILLGDVRVPQIGSRIEPLGALARLTLDVSPSTPVAVTQEGSRLLIRFEADALDATMPASTVPDLIQAVRPGDTAASLVVDLGPRFASFRSAVTAADRGAGRLVVEVTGQTTEVTPTPPVPAAATSPNPPPLIDLAPTGGIRTVVVDAGHGGSEDGARGAGGTLEKTVTLALARRLKGVLESRLGVRVILTRDADRNVGLDERAALANNNKADLFVSLHANASVRPAMSGAEVFYLSLEEYGEEAQRLAHADPDLLPVVGGGSRDIEVTPWEMAQARYIDRSATLAQAIESTLRDQVPMSPRALQQAPFRVLVGANMPAVLVEVAFLSNPQQEQAVSTEGFQNTIVEALVNAIVRFRDGTPLPPGVAPVPPPPAGGRGAR